jgi:hypothetical protein
MDFVQGVDFAGRDRRGVLNRVLAGRESSMPKSTRISAFAFLLGLGACVVSESAGDFTYICAAGGGMFDGPSCEHRLTDRYLLRYGEGSGDNVILAYVVDGGGSAALIDHASHDVVAQLGLDDRLIVVKLRSGRIYVAPAQTEGWPEIVGPLTEQEFASQYTNPPSWRTVQ